jgi:hypothetical protein
MARYGRPAKHGHSATAPDSYLEANFRQHACASTRPNGARGRLRLTNSNHNGGGDSEHFLSLIT